ncbi:MAG: diguanylate cyclase [Armatimonadota bacterium]
MERKRDMQICLSMLNDQCISLQRCLTDHSLWDETWSIVNHPDKEWLEENLIGWLPEHFGIEVVVLTDKKLNIVASSGLNDRLRKKIMSQPAIASAAKGKQSVGFIRCGNSVYMIAAAPVLHSSGKGPINGTLTTAKLLDREIISKLASTAKLGLALYAGDKPIIYDRETTADLLPKNISVNKLDSMRNGGTAVRVGTDHHKRIYVWHGLKDWNNEPIASFITITPRNKIIDAARTTKIVSIAIILCCLIMALQVMFQSRVYTLAQHAMIDELTGVYNHRYLQERLSQELNRSKRYRRSLAIALLDIDHFKQINDEYGHQVGDQALRQLAHLLQDMVRDTDVVARYGGEEFMVIMPETKLRSAMAAAERIRKKVENTVFEMKVAGTKGRSSSKLSIQFTVSLGVSSYPTHAMRGDELIMAADLALFAAKNTSRNAVRSYNIVQDQEPASTDGPVTIHLAMREGSLSTVRALAAAVDARDPLMRGHSEKVAICALALGQHLKLSGEEMSTIRTAALLHDVGRIAVPDDILSKPGALSDEELAIIKQHSVIGAEILSNAPQLKQVAKIVRYHHERYDGSGYPDGLAGEDIPLASRIIAVADAYDAMTSDRAYRAAFGSGDVLRNMKENVGCQFDPGIFEALEHLENSGKLRKLLKSLKDEMDKAA